MTSAPTSGPPDLVYVLAASAVLAGIILWQGRRRRHALADMAAQLGLTFSGDPSADGKAVLAQLRTLADLPLFSRGFHQRATNVLAGRRAGREVRVFDYVYRYREHGKGSTDLTVVLVPGGGAGIPDFVLAPETTLDKLGEVFGGKDLDFQANPRISERYRLRGADEAAIRRAFTPEVLAHFERETGWHVEVSGGHLVAYRGAGCLSPKNVPGLVDGALRIVELLAAK